MDLDALIARVAALDIETKKAIDAEIQQKWLPSPGPQTEAYFSQADILLYGGQAGGGKTDIALGLAFNEHTQTLIMRRQYTDLTGMTERAVQINGTRRGYNGSIPPKLRVDEEKLIEFGACKDPGDEENWMGRPHDLIVLDEAVQFSERQVRFLMGWNRSTKAGQRCRVLFCTNPPLNDEGQWVVKMFAPWLDPDHHNRAKPGELRWYVVDGEKDIEVPDSQSVVINGATLIPQSRTFIPAKLSDNPYLANTDYQAKLDALPEPFKSAFRDGNFMLLRKDSQNQLIPTEWLRLAQKRWTPAPPTGVPMCAIGLDPANGGDCDTTLAPRYDGWFAPIIAVPGKDTPNGPSIAGLVVSNRRDDATVVVDMGGGYGGSTYDHLKENSIPVHGYNGAHASSARTEDRQLNFCNYRAESYWKFREALDPDQPGGSPICLPDDPLLFAELAAPTFIVKPNGILIEDKKKISERLGRSPDRADAVVMSWSHGLKQSNLQGGWQAQTGTRKRGATPKVILGHEHQRRAVR